jgi:hypothetical protein
MQIVDFLPILSATNAQTIFPPNTPNKKEELNDDNSSLLKLHSS